MSSAKRVLIQGAGIGGLTLATGLAQRGISVDVVEATGPKGVLGVGLNQPANALAALDEIGVRDQCLAIGYPFEELLLWDDRSEQILAIPPTPGRYGTPSNNAIGRPGYNRILRAAADDAGVRIRTGTTIWEMTEHTTDVEVAFATYTGKRVPPSPNSGDDGHRYDAVVGFDGVGSRIREHLFGSRYSPEFTGFAAWRVSLPRPASLTHIVMAMAGEVKAVLTPISATDMYMGVVSPEPGNPRYAVEEFPRRIRERLAPFTGLIGELRDAITPDSLISYAPLTHMAVREPWFRGRIAIAGDAAHTAPPHLAQGAAMAVEDAVTLAEALAAHDEPSDAFATWYQRRHERALFVADMSLALLRQESGIPLSAAESELAQMGIPGAQYRLATEAY